MKYESFKLINFLITFVEQHIPVKYIIYICYICLLSISQVIALDLELIFEEMAITSEFGCK